MNDEIFRISKNEIRARSLVDIVYYGQRVEKDFLINHEKDILEVIGKLEGVFG